MPENTYNLSGTKNVDGVVHVPVSEVIKLCEMYPSMTAQQLHVLLKVSLLKLQKNESMKSVLPVVDTTKKSFFSRLFQK